MIIKKNKKEIYLIALILISLYLSLMETFIPKPFPWMKIGLSNISVLIALEKFDEKMALKVLIYRIIVQGLMLGTVFTPGFIISLLSGVISTLFMIFLFRFRKNLSLVAISLASGFTHNCLQLIVVYFLLFRNINIASKSILVFIWIFLFIGVVAGAIVGVVGEKLNLKKIEVSIN